MIDCLEYFRGLALLYATSDLSSVAFGIAFRHLCILAADYFSQVCSTTLVLMSLLYFTLVKQTSCSNLSTQNQLLNFTNSVDITIATAYMQFVVYGHYNAFLCYRNRSRANHLRLAEHVKRSTQLYKESILYLMSCSHLRLQSCNTTHFITAMQQCEIKDRRPVCPKAIDAVMRKQPVFVKCCVVQSLYTSDSVFCPPAIMINQMLSPECYNHPKRWNETLLQVKSSSFIRQLQQAANGILITTLLTMDGRNWQIQEGGYLYEQEHAFTRLGICVRSMCQF